MYTIRKEFKFECSHIVRNAYSQRCRSSWHGHSYIVEVFLKGAKTNKDDGMLVDFGILKDYFTPIIDSWDHAAVVWENDKPHIQEFFLGFSLSTLPS